MAKKNYAVIVIVLGILLVVSAPFTGLFGNILIGVIVVAAGVFWYRKIVEAPPRDAVYYIEGSEVYHYYDSCLDVSAKDIHIVSESKAKAKGMRPCKKCLKLREEMSPNANS